MNTSISAPDTLAPSAPGTLTASGGLGQIGLSWGAATDNVGVARYNVHRGTSAGFTPPTGNRIAQPTGTSYNDSALAPGTYFYKVTAEDLAGNVGPAGNEASAVSAADTTPPTVSITAPAGGATVSGTVAINASASDNGTVAGVQFKLDGANLGAEDTSAPYSFSWDTFSVANGSHTLGAVARDAAGNTTAATNVVVTASNTGSPGLVAAWAFDETSGTTTADQSGNGNVGTLGNATRRDDRQVQQRALLQRHERVGHRAGLRHARPDHRDDARGLGAAGGRRRLAHGDRQGSARQPRLRHVHQHERHLPGRRDLRRRHAAVAERHLDAAGRHAGATSRPPTTARRCGSS